MDPKTRYMPDFDDSDLFRRRDLRWKARDAEAEGDMLLDDEATDAVDREGDEEMPPPEGVVRNTPRDGRSGG